MSKPIAARFLDGYNGTIFAYGQTGSGKTYTVEGSARRYNQRGIIPRVISYVYDALEKKDPEEDWKIEISFMEIYQDVGYDLLNPGSQGGSMMVKLPKVSVRTYVFVGILEQPLTSGFPIQVRLPNPNPTYVPT